MFSSILIDQYTIGQFFSSWFENNAVRMLAADLGVSTSGLAIAWLLAQGEHVVPIPGTRSVDHLNELAAGADLKLTSSDIEAIEKVLPIGWCHGDRYSDDQWQGPERYC